MSDTSCSSKSEAGGEGSVEAVVEAGSLGTESEMTASDMEMEGSEEWREDGLFLLDDFLPALSDLADLERRRKEDLDLERDLLRFFLERDLVAEEVVGLIAVLETDDLRRGERGEWRVERLRSAFSS